MPNLWVKTYSDNKTSSYKGNVYFQCVNRKKGASTNNKCLAKVKYNSIEKDIEVVDLHNPNCTVYTKEKLTVNENYCSQKEILIKEMSENQNLSVVNAINLLRDKNVEASPQSKKFPLNYLQVKKIVNNFRQDNQLNGNASFADSNLLKTIDGALFRRCHNQYNTIYKSKIFLNFY